MNTFEYHCNTHTRANNGCKGSLNFFAITREVFFSYTNIVYFFPMDINAVVQGDLDVKRPYINRSGWSVGT